MIYAHYFRAISSFVLAVSVFLNTAYIIAEMEEIARK
jgi:hypothetical protein